MKYHLENLVDREKIKELESGEVIEFKIWNNDFKLIIAKYLQKKQKLI